MGKTEKNEGTERRSFLNGLWLLLAAIGITEFTGLAAWFFKTRPTRASGKDAASMVEVGLVNEFEPNTVTAFQQGGFYLVRLENGGFLALSRQCTHLGCTVPWNDDEKKFICPCHASVFDITGNVIKSPAPRALDLHPVKIDNNMVLVDSARRIKRSLFQDDQVVRPPQSGKS